nr:hypothetical protein [Tanacetum cinerariifolium]
MGEPLSPDRVFDFPEDELEPHPAYDFLAPTSLPGYAGNPNNNNRWLKADDYLLGKLEAMVDEQMVVLAIKEMVAPLMDMEEDLAALFGEDDDSEVFDEEKAWEVGAQVEQVQQTTAQRDETTDELTQQGEHTDAVHFRIGETDCSIREKTTRTLVVLVALHFHF